MRQTSDALFVGSVQCMIDCVISPRYCAPEVCRPASMTDFNEDANDIPAIRYGFKADVWSLGCLVLHLATGLRPFSKYSKWQIFGALVGGERPDISSDLPTDLRDFIEKCLHV